MPTCPICHKKAKLFIIFCDKHRDYYACERCKNQLFSFVMAKDSLEIERRKAYFKMKISRIEEKQLQLYLIKFLRDRKNPYL